ncbi:MULTISPECIES: acyl-CoA dehydrogenase family protein [Pseudomonas]|uniref:acyl-CoA dehydrogenase family protein n=1 Tax=Pseudomonas TaxID=286 RepID=UPI000D005988|nr:MULTISPECIES: acyl-CoA dehydrogenase family protein [Pseudomonas]PRA45831.1 acyl-CoA dehydrogenase [Pseudomonas sp. MYb115]QXN52309.1 acyl-CoA dehydrogenase family protein [Pseudomonas fluorescens]WSO26643.1 acyl-CoA dehydrogenase family protein [Pseudomonas fluorescens]
MWQYQAPLRDMQFVFEQWLQAPEAWQQMPAFEALDLPLACQVLEEAGRFSAQVLAPLNSSGDRQGCRFESGQVTTPDGFAQAYQAYVDGGWPALACAETFGGQGLPQLLDAALQEMLYASNHAWAMYTGIAHGAYLCLKTHAPEWIQQRYLPSIVSGETLPTMCLTEPQAGSDVGLLRCRAEPQDDGSYRLSGSKLFISGGEHDLTENILHLVLARLPGAPSGSRGVSLFLVPKRLDGGLSNAVRCDGIEHKMGIKGSATCSLVFDGAQGWLIGEANRGLAAMFVMMNSARLHVGLQGLGHAESASQNASAYALERKQMRAPARPVEVEAEVADPIHFHPAMRRVLLELRAYAEGMRAVGYWAAHLLDQSEQAEDLPTRQRALQLAELLTPVIKAFFTEQGFRLASNALQVFGGYGYVSEFAIEQTLRDSRIAMIYEGSNEIQANDLLLRKVLGDEGRAFGQLLAVMREEAELACNDTRFGAELVQLCDKLETVQLEIGDLAVTEREYPYRAAGDFLRLCGVALLGFSWARAARVSRLLPDSDPLRANKLETARFFFAYLLPEADQRLAAIRAARAPLPFLI